MTFRRLTRPRRLGLLTGVDRDQYRPGRQRYSYHAGDRIAGDLTVIGHLAAGRNGHLYQVWSARDWCAFTCKILAPGHKDDRRARAALRREARILRRVNHPNLVRYFGEGEHEGMPYILMEYLEGPSVFELLDGRPGRRLGVPDAVRTAIHVGAGLHHLHSSGFLHLDLKPANLLLRGSMPILVDFDAARPLEGGRPAKPLGTAPYMAPEQVRCDVPGPAADIYGLAAVLYEMLTGRWPFEDVFTGHEQRTGEEYHYPQLGNETPPPPRRFNDEIPESLETIVMRCLAPDPGDRYAALHPMLLDLVGVLDEPVSLWPTGVQAERRKMPRD